jgi:hypothetical protein
MAQRNTLEDDLNYQHAKHSLRQLVASLDLSEAERAGLESDLEELYLLMDKLEHEVIHIAAFGMVGRGKSSLLNALVGQPIFVTGPTHGVTQTSQKAVWLSSWETRLMPKRNYPPALSLSQQEPIVQTATITGLGGSRLELIDTPGLDEVGGESRAQLAHHVARQADLILFVVSGDMTRVEFDALAQLREASKPMILVFNKIDQFPDADRQAVYEKICNERVKQILSPNEIVMAAASPRVARAVVESDGTLSARLDQGEPDVDGLRLKILEILHREGRSLIALNTLLFADHLNQQVIERKLEQRASRAQQLIWTSACTKAAAVALNPLTVVDTIGGAVVDISLILRLSQLYGLAMTRKGALQLLQKIVLSMISLGAGEMVATLGLGSVKTLLGSAAPLTGGFSLGAYASVAMTQAALAGISSYVIGSAARSYLANGANWGPEGPKAAIAQILENMDEASITARIRDELKARLHASTLNDA